MADLAVHIVDAFTDRPFGGNSAGVVLLTEPRPDDWMQRVAAELNHPETAFADVRGADPIPLRWFTPTTEVDLCGHATLATAHVLGGDRRFATRSGVLTARSVADGIELDFPADSLEPVEPPADVVAGLAGVAIVSVQRGRDDFVVRLGSAGEVRAVRPDLAAFGRLSARGVIVTAFGGADADFVSRCFYPAFGIDEDPVTGSAHCALAAHWGPELNKPVLVGRQLSARGGTVTVVPDGDRVRLVGRAVTVLSGRLTC
ncbi:PhzF family phenazine biosynthesis protein [Actinokineospora iranica]|uniref:Phenazine biosynthesis protein PhzF family n=1 Tax=Actinokineospora iranica TaxID=1271860 RepID=A0A1G6UYT9_9PSEU|nr:PhzF family phenazine biosynthesis protein [Actinokineospora iranica]SDD45817.1 phenazine biosynthesis protein PhzF family [Actinokineospora iranica]